MICNPNNPTGIDVPRSAIMQIVQAAPDAAILLDEAYFDFYGQTMLDQIGKLPNLFIARTFSKAYGLAGLRLGVMVGDLEQMSVLRRMASPFNVNAFAIECLAEALADRQFVADYVAQVIASREWLRKELEKLEFQVLAQPRQLHSLPLWPREKNHSRRPARAGHFSARPS